MKTPLQYLAEQRDKAQEQLDAVYSPAQIDKWNTVVEAYNAGIWAVKKVMEDIGAGNQ